MQFHCAVVCSGSEPPEYATLLNCINTSSLSALLLNTDNIPIINWDEYEAHHFYLVATCDHIFALHCIFRRGIGEVPSRFPGDLFLCIVNKVFHLFCF